MEIESFFKKYNRVTVAVSGGVDSAVLLYLAKQYADKVYACFVKSEFQPEFELQDALSVCRFLHIELKVINASVLSESKIAYNPKNRCYYCKRKIFSEICSFAKSNNSSVIEGTNADDDIDDRPGFKAINELGVLSPLRLCGLTKNDVRKIAISVGIPVGQKPSYACLATRVPTGTEITKDILVITEKAESKLFEMGFSDFRVRYDKGNAILELTKEDRLKYLSNKDKIDLLLKPYYKHIQLSDRVR